MTSWSLSRGCPALLLAVLAAVVVLAQATPTRPRYIDCVDSAECSPYECCVLGMGRFSVPTCRPRPELGASCRPGHVRPHNTTVGYPDGSTVPLSNVFLIMCPCAAGLSCDEDTTTCIDPAEHYNFNALY